MGPVTRNRSIVVVERIGLAGAATRLPGLWSARCCGPAQYPPRYSMTREDCETEAQLMRLNRGYDARCYSSWHDQISPDKRDRWRNGWSE
jgi:hypothetical protein